VPPILGLSPLSSSLNTKFTIVIANFMVVISMELNADIWMLLVICLIVITVGQICVHLPT
jgi:hypothetical protein